MKLQLHTEAEEEVFQAAAWYQERVSGLGDDFLNEVDHWFAVLVETPFGWPRWPRGPRLTSPIRRALLRRFPFAIAYQVFEDRVFVLAVAHTSRRPLYWVTRVDDNRPPG
ncbi:MAG: type II toxin-antitoxin system RelE/ParE family toxin [Candidatus Eisenbacteria bacterium]|uniref:Type II toxin-antitoxin system RelE/ParE family toxin n=1 Tax=Eiseniibacteriota bacterium TaxID=2212470 RepID=A0A956M0N8_UNCEI|nr:type II toxin-antitoxin system RelE/ParE family toxin [Candidatus Eisenbacteria bacterium]